jgi:hypothetical protein
VRQGDRSSPRRAFSDRHAHTALDIRERRFTAAAYRGAAGEPVSGHIALSRLYLAG